ncbi:heat-inducible transcriptional repressor HrcA [Sporanaerobacter acetigenes]|uniref:Heat-inducible transcription repressor HrcA n=1 Tax=Sporanaerobacter acetigenes DSM 13106 TaxID=1123281 RepID=A0A1M5UT13_9FIRM|nr:heat-inducible transcriptional repressor HrcA [Sporanaerobacter acetigenes]SHH65853.1 heat-inducible transcription repressor HrcA [Sporanaerobacter acetigenes DSM 13106]
MLDERKLRVLHAIINSYISSAEPIGSRTISKKYDLGVSSATIRNEMSDLEDLGYLNKPYTSAGRVPSDKAYRLYVDMLLKDPRAFIDMRKKQEIKKNLLKEAVEMDNLIENSTKILSKITNYTALAIAPQFKRSTIKHIQLIPIDEYEILVVIVSDSGIVKNTIFRIDNQIPNDQLNIISNFLNEKLKGLTIEEIGNEIDTVVFKEMYEYKNIIESIIPVINQSLEEVENVEVFADGVTNIFNFPEYSDVTKARSFLSFIEDKDLVVDILLKNTLDDFEITIGGENSIDEIKNCSLITATYKLDGDTIGKIGVIGPTRMDYFKVINAVNLLAINLNEIIGKFFMK